MTFFEKNSPFSSTFGAPMPERSYRLVMKKGPNYGTNPTDVYPAYVNGMEPVGNIASEGVKSRVGFNGKENDNEIKGNGNQQDYGMRIYDTRLGRFLSVDPLSKNYPWYTPFQFSGNKPIWAIDVDGLEENGTNSGVKDPNTVITPPNTTPNPGFPEKNRSDFAGEYERDYGRAGPDAVAQAVKNGIANSNISYVPDAGPNSATKGDFFWEKNAGSSNTNPTGGTGTGQMQTFQPIQVNLNLPLPPNMQFVAIPQPPIISNVNAGQILFAGGQWNLDATSAGPINRIANMLAGNPNMTLTIRGNALMGPTDNGNTPVGANAAVTYNQLKMNRANAVRAALIGINSGFLGRINVRRTPDGSNVQSIIFQVATPNPQPPRWVLQAVPATPGP